MSLYYIVNLFHFIKKNVYNNTKKINFSTKENYEKKY